MTQLILLAKEIAGGGWGLVAFALAISMCWMLLKAFKMLMEKLDTAFELHGKLSESLMGLLKDEQEYKTTLTGVMMRIEQKLDSPITCPLAINKEKR
jgi:hypothetical protein